MEQVKLHAYKADYQDYAEREIVRIKKKLSKKGKKGKNRP
jgi:hypothetical protein